MTRLLRVVFLAVLAHAWPVEAAAEAYQTYYPNGLEVTIVPDQARPMAGVMALVGAGLRTETPALSGASHFVEHLLFNGTETLNQEELYAQIDMLAGYCNAATREECTLYFLLVPPENVARGVGLLNRMLSHSALPEANVEKERGVILSELRQDRSMEFLRVDGLLRSVLYRGTPYAMPILGSEQTVASLSRDAVADYYRTYYAPNNTKLVLIGTMDVSEALAAVDTTFGRERARSIPSAEPIVRPLLPPQTTVTGMIEQPRGFAAIPTSGLGDPALPVTEVLTEVLRLRCAAAGDHRLDVYRHAFGGFGWLVVGAVGEPGLDAGVPLERAMELVRGMGDAPPSHEEVETVKARLRAEELFLREKLHFFLIARPNEMWALGAQYAADRARRLDGVTTEAVRSLALKLAETGTVRRIALVPPPTPEGGAAERGGAVDTTILGMTASIRREPEAPLFGLHILFRDRGLLEPVGKDGLTEVLHRVMAAGPEGCAPEHRWASLGAQVTFFDNPFFSHDDVYLSPRYSYVRLELPAETWREGVAFLEQCLRYPSLDEQAVATAKADVLRAQAYQTRDARYAARAAFLRILLGEHPGSRLILGTPETVGHLEASDVERFHRDYVNRGNAIVTVVSHAVASDVADELASLLPGAIADTHAWPPLPDTDADVVHVDTLGTGRAHVVWGYVIGAVPEKRQPPLRLAVSSLSTRMTQRVREELGLAYGVGCGLHWLGDGAWLQVEVGTRPEVVEEVVSAVRGVVADSRGWNVSAQDVAREAERRRGRWLLRSLTRVGEAYYAGLELLHGRQPLEGEGDVTADEVVSAARRYLRTSPAVTVVVR